MRTLGLLCTLLLGTGLVLAQSDEAVQSYGEPAQGGNVAPTLYNVGVQGFAGDGDILGVPAFGQPVTDRAGEDCPTEGFICGQDKGACPATNTQWYFYTDLQFCSPAPTTCQRVRCENFPPPGVTIPPSKSIGVITFWGVYVNDASDGCTKTGGHQFRIRFYNEMDDYTDPTNPAKIVYTEFVTALAADTGETVTFATVPATLWQFTAILTTPVNMTSGFFSISGDGTPGCYFLWEGSNEGDNLFWNWWETSLQPTWETRTEFCDMHYCFSEKIIGACCQDCLELCEEDSNKYYCEALRGRFVVDGNCTTSFTPPCGQGTGACCYDNGDCQIMTCQDCEPQEEPGCVGDLNCDGMIDFGDINPFVLFLSNQVTWQATYPECPPTNGDINCDGVYGQASFADINPFVALMTQCGTGCPCPGPISCNAPRNEQPPHWAGPNTSCAPWPTGGCCTVVVPSGATQENETPTDPEGDCKTDVFNGGCNMDVPAFSTITAGQTIYGESATFDGTRDMDWYTFNLPGPRTFTVTVEAEFEVVIFAFREGQSAPCDGYVSVKAPVGPPADGTNKCTQVVLETRCLPGGNYILVVAPASFSGVPCRADYSVTLAVGGACEVLNTCGNCPGGADYVEGTPAGGPDPGYCQFDPDDPTIDPENGGCNADPYAFELLPYDDTQSPHTFTFCGKLWANQGYRDLDWYGLELTSQSQVQWQVMSEVPCRATMLFNDLGGAYGPPPPDCTTYYYWVDTLVDPCVTKIWSGTMYYEPGSYWYLVMPEDAAGSLWYDYPCPVGSADFGNDYTITMTVTGIQCEAEVLAKPKSNTEAANDPPCPPGSYNDTYNSGCDAASPPGPRLALGVGTTPTWQGRSGSWLADPNDPDSVQKDHDWYEFTLTANRRFKVYLYADFAATWEIWKSNDCDFGPIEGFDVPPCYDLGVYTIRCYAAGTYWLRVYPTGRAQCGKYYWLSLTEPANCAVCNFACVGTDLDDPCDDLTDYDTNAGCDDPNGPPPGFMAFAINATYCGRSYAGLQNGAPYYDPDWFTITQTNAAARKMGVDIFAEFLVHLECYTSCGNYPNTPIPGLDFITPLTAGVGCPNGMPRSTESFPQNTVIYCRVTIVDQLGDLLTKYYPCAKGWNRWRLIPRLAV